MNPIDAYFHTGRDAIRKAFMPFVTAGDPDLATTERVIPALAAAGAGVIEVGFPFSDPIADGPVVQASYTRALNKGLKLDDLFAAVERVHARPEIGQVPLVGMASYSLVFRRGPERFLNEALAAGFAGAIVPDLPLEEADQFARLAADCDFKVILLVTPTTPRDRAARIAKLSTGFLYCVSVTGITGERERLPDQLLEQLRWLRQQTSLPLCVGFGVSKPEQVVMLRDVCDGVIVGSALVRRLEQIGERPADKVIAEVQEYVRSLVAALGD